MSYFRQDATIQECLLELISNQLELASRQASFEEATKDTKAEPKQFLENQAQKLKGKIISQRNELGIAVDGV